MDLTLTTLGPRLVGRGLCMAAPAWRRVLEHGSRVRFVGLTGSAGKTTTASLLARMLALAGPVTHTDRLVGRLNDPQFAARLVFSTRRHHRFCIYELGTGGPGMIVRFIRVLRPHVGVVTNIAGDHYTAFRSLDETAREKGRLIAALPADGIAVLNAGDPRVAAMAGLTRARVVTYGIGTPNVDVRAEAISAVWPQRLSLTIVTANEQVQVRTRFVGEHFALPVTAACATALACGIPLVEAARVVEDVEPPDGRCSVHQASGVTFIRDDWKAPYWSLPAAIRIMETARARRRVLIIGTISDYPGASSPKYRSVARLAAAAVDQVIFVGPVGYRTHFEPSDRVKVFESVAEANTYLDGYLTEGDLVMLKGSATADHLQRLLLARDGGHACWKRACGRARFCTACELRHKPAER
jgi:UDP-N-acetylmuramyl pentapeptide synthase